MKSNKVVQDVNVTVQNYGSSRVQIESIKEIRTNISSGSAQNLGQYMEADWCLAANSNGELNRTLRTAVCALQILRIKLMWLDGFKVNCFCSSEY